MFVRDNLDDRDEILESQSHPLGTQDELSIYEFPKSKEGRQRDVNPKDEFDHDCDDLGYTCRELHIPKGNAASVEAKTFDEIRLTPLRLGPGPQPARWKQQMGVDFS